MNLKSWAGKVSSTKVRAVSNSWGNILQLIRSTGKKVHLHLKMGPRYPLCDIMVSTDSFYIQSYMLVVKSSWVSSDLRRAEEKQPMRATKAQNYNNCQKNLDWGAGLKTSSN